MMPRVPRLSLHCIRLVIDRTKCFLLLAVALVYLILASSAFAQTKDIVFSGGGTTTFDGWSNMTVFRLGSLNYGSWPGGKVWTNALAANVGSGGGLLNRLAGSPNGGGPFPSDTSLYFGSSTTVANTLGGTLGVSRAPVSGVRTVVFQIELGEGQPQGQTRYFFHEPVGNPTAGRPTLYVNGQPLSAPTHTALVNQRSTVDGGGANFDDPVFVNTYGYQWNISTSNVTSLEVRFSCVEHVSIYSMRLDQTSASQTGNVLVGTRVINLGGNLGFGNVTVGQTTNRTLTISNSGNSTLNVTNISYPQGFRGSWSNGVIALATNASTNITVTFAPTNAQSFGGNIVVGSDATSGTNTISASGTGTSTATRVIGLGGNFAFGNVAVGQTTNRTLTISNSGNSTLTVSNISYPQGFRGSWSNGVIALATNASTNITVTFAPTNAQLFSNNIMVSSDATSGSNAILASGTGTPPPSRVISAPAALNFPNCPFGSSNSVTLTISNGGNAPLTVSNIEYPSGFSGAWSGSIPAANSQNVSVFFTPTAAGDFGGTISVVSDATAGSGTVSVSARGTPPTIAPVRLGAPVLIGSNTVVTNTFRSTPATWLDVAFTDNVAASNSWIRYPSRVYSAGGEFDVVLTNSGDHRTNWQRGMFFRLIYPTKP